MEPDVRPEASTLDPLLITSQGTLLTRWEHVAVRVHDVARGEILVITTDHTVRTSAPVTTGTGWTCQRPSLRWLAGDLLARSRTVCTADRDYAGSVTFAFQVAPRAHVTAILTGPPERPGSPRTRTAVLRTNPL